MPQNGMARAEHLPRFSCFASLSGYGPQATIQIALGTAAAPSRLIVKKL